MNKSHKILYKEGLHVTVQGKKKAYTKVANVK